MEWSTLQIILTIVILETRGICRHQPTISLYLFIAIVFRLPIQLVLTDDDEQQLNQTTTFVLSRCRFALKSRREINTVDGKTTKNNPWALVGRTIEFTVIVYVRIDVLLMHYSG